MNALRVKSLQKKQKLSRKAAKAQRFRKEKLCVFFASLRLCVRFSFWLPFIRVVYYALRITYHALRPTPFKKSTTT
jgi:hypothetical protein